MEADISAYNSHERGDIMDILTIAAFLGGTMIGGSLGVLLICIFMGMSKPRRRRYTDGKIENVLYRRKC